MPPDTTLDNVIRRVEPTVAVDPSCQVLVTIDTRTGQPPHTGWWLARGREHHVHFLVTNSHNASALARRHGLRIGIEDFARGLAFDLLVDYEARCAPGRETRVAQALWRGAKPQETLEALLRSWILERLAGRAPELAHDVYAASRALDEVLRTRAAQETGLTLETRTFLADMPPEELPFGPLGVRANLCDCQEEVEIEVEGALAIAPDERPIAMTQRGRESAWLDSLIAETARYFSTQVTLHRYHFELAAGVQRELRHHLDSFLLGSGRRISRLKLNGAPLPGIVESRLIEHAFSHHPYDYPDKVEIHTEALLQLVDLGRHRNAHAPDIEAWTRREVERATVDCLFGETYTSLCLYYEEKKAAIERLMKERAATIGYELKQLVTITNLAIEDLRRPFIVRVEGEFATEIAEIEVGLAVEARVLLTQPSEIAYLLDRNERIDAYVTGILRDRLRETLHHVDPESFYMRFESDEGGRSVRARLETAIRKTLTTEFHAQVLALSCKQRPTELSLLLARLMGPLHEFEVEIAGRGGPLIEFLGSYRVTGVDPRGWEHFKTTKPEPDTLRRTLIRHLQHSLSDEPATQLLRMLNEERKKSVDGLMQKRARDEFGLVVRLMDWSRRRLGIEEAAGQQSVEQIGAEIGLRSMRIKRRQELGQDQIDDMVETSARQREQIKILEDRLARNLKEEGGPQEETAWLRKQIAELKEELRSTTEESRRELARGVASRPMLIESMSFGDIRRVAPAENDTATPPGPIDSETRSKEEQ